MNVYMYRFLSFFQVLAIKSSLCMQKAGAPPPKNISSLKWSIPSISIELTPGKPVSYLPESRFDIRAKKLSS